MKLAARLLFLLAWLGAAPLAFCQPAGITGRITDASGAVVAHVQVKLSLDGREPDRETESTDSGDFSFANVTAGPFHVSFTADGFAVKAITGEARAGETVTLPPIVLAASFSTQVNVTSGVADVAEVQIKEEEQQRLIGIVPNFFVSYDPDAAPLTPKQKFELTWKGFVDITAFVGTGIGAGIGEARNTNPGFGRGVDGYAKRYAAGYGEFVTRRVIDKVVMTTVFRQDPRYFYKGTGSVGSRALYAISRAVICRGDDRRSQLCYSALIGRFAADALSNLYLPVPDRDTRKAVIENAGLGIVGNAAGNLFQEFVARKLTHKKREVVPAGNGGAGLR